MDMQFFQSGEKPEYILIQPVGEHDMASMKRELQLIGEYTGKSFVHAAVRVNNWNTDLTPWEAEPVFGNTPFGAGASETLRYLKDHMIPQLVREYGDLPLILGGYSLAGLFSLWCGYESSDFYGIAAASPSVWYPGFRQYATGRKLHTSYTYLSLGDKEAKTKNPRMRTVADEIEWIYAKYQKDIGTRNTILEWNHGNHFMDPDIRMAKAYAWIMNEKKRV